MGEMNVVVADEFRDGNVPALWRPVSVAQRAFAGFTGYCAGALLPGDSACDEETLLTWLRHEKRADGPLGFAVSARRNAALRQEIVDTPAERWEVYEENAEVEKHWADVAYFPGGKCRESVLGTVALCGHPDPEEAGRTVRRRTGLQVLRSRICGNGNRSGCCNDIARKLGPLRRCTM